VPRAIQSIVIVIVTTMLSAASTASTHAQQKPAASGAGEACSLLSQQDAATALGEAVTGPRATAGPSMGGTSACEYSGSGIHKVNLNVMHLTPDMAAMYKALCGQKTKDGLTGLGDVACWYNEKHEELQVLKAGTFFSIELRKSGNPTEAIKGVAKKVYDRVK
jgi:hypothetical protein